jgi:hypothetical protein
MATVRFPNGDAFDSVQVMDVDSRKDIAILKIKQIDLKALRVGSSNAAQVGDTVYSLSNPLGLQGTLSQGIISGIRQLDGYRLLQITAPISHGSSGGPLFNTNGEVIGITAAVLEGGQSLNFAIPIDYARGMIESSHEPRPLVSVYSAGYSAGVVNYEPGTGARNDLRREPIAFLRERLGIWTLDDARSAMGPPLSHRHLYGTDYTILGEIYAFSDPSGVFHEFELVFTPNTERMFYLYVYPSYTTWKDWKRIWGDDAKVVKYSNGDRRYDYNNLRANVTVDKYNNVIAIGYY